MPNRLDITDENLNVAVWKFVQNMYHVAIEREIVEWIVREGLRHHLCRFVVKLIIENKEAASRFVTALGDAPITSHVLRWVEVVHRLGLVFFEVGESKTDLAISLCDIMQAEDEVLRANCNTLEVCRLSDDLNSVREDLDIVVHTLQSLR